MTHSFRSTLLYSAVLSGILLSCAPVTFAQVSLDSEESAFLGLINNFRAQNGVQGLQVSAALENSSRWMSNDMAAKNYFSHTDSAGRDPFSRQAAFGYAYGTWGENIAAGYSDARSTFNQWLTACDADGSGNCTYAHRVNMLSSNFNVIGIGRAYNANSSYRWYWTTDFGGYVDQTLNSSPAPTIAAPVIGSFYASPSSLTVGQSTPLIWAVSGASSLSLDNGLGDVSNATSKLVSPAQTTTYTLTATNSGGAASARVTVTVTPAPDLQPPTIPAIVSAIARSQTQVDLGWTTSTDNVGVAGYQISRNGSVLTVVASGVTSYADTAVTANTLYSYTIKAYDAAGNLSGASNLVQVFTPAVPVFTPPPPPVSTPPVTPPPSPSTPAPPSAKVCPGPAIGAFTGCYYNNQDLIGTPALVRTDNFINFSWGAGSPDPSVTALNYSVRWEGIFNFDQGNYVFFPIISDGMRMYIDGNAVMYRWRDQPVNAYRVLQTLSQGNHLITVEYYEHTGTATAILSWLKN